MALVLPSKNNTKSGLILPGNSNNTQAQKINQLKLEEQLAKKEASKSVAARFLEGLGPSLGEFATDVGQGVLRSLGSIGQFALTGRPDVEIKRPESKASAVFDFLYGERFGEKGVSLQTTGEEVSPLVEQLGLSSETAKKLAPAIGFAMASLDVLPGGKGAKMTVEELAEQLGKQVIKTADENIIKKSIKGFLTGSEDDIAKLSTSLKEVNKLDDAKKIIDASLKDGKFASRIPIVEPSRPIPKSIEQVADSIITTNKTKTAFLDDLKNVLRKVDDPSRDLYSDFVNNLNQINLKPSLFYDVVNTGGKKSLQRLIDNVLPSPFRSAGDSTVSALNEISRNIPKARTVGAVEKKAIYELQTDAIDVIKRNIPPSFRGDLLTKVRNANTPTKFRQSMEFIQKRIDDINETKILQKELSSRRSKISFLRKIGEFNQTVIRDSKVKLGIDKPVRKMSLGELDSMVTELKSRVAFKRSKGGISLPKEQAKEASEQFYEGFIGTEQTLKEKATRAVGNNISSFNKTVEDTLGVVSTRLANIDPTLRTSVRRLIFNTNKRVIEGNKILNGLSKKVAEANIPKNEFIKLDVAMKNGFIHDVEKIAEKYGFLDEVNQLRKSLDKIYLRANEVGLDVAYRSNYFPRMFKQDSKSTKEILEYFGQSEARGTIEKAWQEASMNLGRPLSEGEKVNIVNTLIRGFRTNNITLSKTGQLKDRLVDIVTPEIYHLYENTFSSTAKYIEAVNNTIEARRFFGKHLDLKNIPANGNTDDIIGAYVNNMIASGKITPAQELELSQILQGLFSGKQMNPFLGGLKNIGYLTVMSSPENALTQIGDLAFAYYRTGVVDATSGLADVFSKHAIRKEDIGIAMENVISEFGDKTSLGSMVGQMFRINGLQQIDRLGKETFINGVWRSLQREAKDNLPKLTKRLEPIFGKETKQVIDDIVTGNRSENAMVTLFHELLDFQPAALSEVPLKYLDSPNGRIFYALKTYTIKLWDVYRREVFQQMKNPKTFSTGLTNLFKLAAVLAVFNGTADSIKDLITGRKVTFEDRVVESIAKAFGFGRYTINQLGSEGLGRTLAEQILPPTQFIDDLTRDFIDVFQNPEEDYEVSKSRTLRDIPVVGKLFYWWFGRGRDRVEAEQEKESDIFQIEIPEVEIPQIPVIEIPEIVI